MKLRRRRSSEPNLAKRQYWSIHASHRDRAMPKLILHVGMPKSGSSAIQLALSAASGNDFIYPDLSGPRFKPHHTDALVELFSSDRERIAAIKSSIGKNMSGSGNDAARIRRAAAEAGNRPVILSSEGAYSYLNIEDLFNLKRFAEEIFDSMAIVAYVREPFGYISSSFHNRIKSRRLSRFKPKFPHYRFLEKFDCVFGPQNVQLWEFDRNKFPNGSVVDDFCSKLSIQPVASAEINVGICRPAVSAIYRLNRIAGVSEEGRLAYSQARAAIIDEFPHQDWPKFRLSPKISQALIDANGEEMDWIERRLGRSLRVKPERLKTDIRSEEDLLEIRPHPRMLLQRIGKSLPLRAKGMLKRALAT